jgi:S-adenosylmethionine:tRNA ribosyltransferase-isomerase
MTPATEARRDRPDSRLLVVDAERRVSHHARRELPELLRRGDLLVVNDAGTLPASLSGRHLPTGLPIELRLASRLTLDAREIRAWRAVLFGGGDWRSRTEDRPAPPQVRPGDRLAFGGALRAEVSDLDGHPRLVFALFEGSARDAWEGILRHGRLVQYSYLREALALWDGQTAFAGPPVAVEAPSAGFVLTFTMLERLRARGVEVVSLTHAAGLSSTGDPALDARLPLPEPYSIPEATARAIAAARAAGRRVVALGTTVVRALESAAAFDGGVAPGPGVATLRIGPTRPPRVVSAIVTGMHEPGTSHHALLEGFADRDVLLRAADEAESRGYLAHEFGDACLVERVEKAA